MQQDNNSVNQTKSQREAALIAKAQHFLGNYRRWAQMALLYDDERKMSEHSEGARFSMERHQIAHDSQRCRAKANLVNLIMEMLPFKDYLILHYRYIIGLPIDRALDSLDIDRSTAYRRQRRALLRVAQLLEEKHYNENGNPTPA